MFGRRDLACVGRFQRGAFGRRDPLKFFGAGSFKRFYLTYAFRIIRAWVVDSLAQIFGPKHTFSI